MRRSLPSLLALAAVCVAAWLLLGRRSAPEREPGNEGRSPEGVAPSASDAPPPLAAPRVERAAGPASARGRASIVGVVRRDGKPVAARVEVTRLHDVPELPTTSPAPTAWLVRRLLSSSPSAAPAGTTRSGEDGRFVFEGLAPGTWRVTATGADDARSTATADLPLDGAIVEVELALGADAEGLRGRVLTADGRPFRGELFVEATSSGDRSPWRQDFDVPPTPLDADGRFQATALARGDVVLTARVKGSFRATSGRVTVPRTEEFVWVVDAGFRLRTGSVVADEGGAPVAGALVLGGGEVDGVTVLASTTTDAAGAFSIRVGGTSGGLRAVASGFTPLRKEVRDLPEGDEPIVFRLARGATITGRVTEAESGRPIAGVRVRAMPEEGRAIGPDAAVTGADGRYAIEGVVAGTYVVLAEGDGWVSQHVAEAEIGHYNPFSVAAKAGETVTFDVTVVHTASVVGVVLDPSGAPVAGAVVASEPRERSGGYYFLNPLERLGERQAISGPDGTFSIDGLVVEGTYVLKATARDGAECYSSLVVVREGSATKVELRFSPERRIEVTVLDAASGASIAGAKAVVLVPAEHGFPDRESAPSTTGADGRAIVLTRGPGALSAQATADGYVESYESVPVPESGQVVVRLARGFVLAGRAVRTDGSPAVGAGVVVHPGHPYSEDSTWEAQADSDGGFRFTFASDTATTVRATLGRGPTALEGEATGTPGGLPIVVTLRPPVERSDASTLDMLVVRVLDADGKPVPAAKAALYRENTGVERDVLDGRVGFRRTDLEILSICVWDAKAADGSFLPLGPARVGPVRPDARELEIRLPPERAIEGVVLGPDGNGVRGVVVRASPGAAAATGAGPDLESEARSDGDGKFRLGRLGDEAYALRVNPPRDLVHPEPVTARGGATDVAIRLRAAAHASITVLDEDGTPVVGAVVTATHGGDGYVNLRERIATDVSGVARLGGLDPAARYVLRVELDRSGSTFLPYASEGWEPKDQTIHLSRSLSIRGVVRDPSGRPVADAEVFVVSDDMAWAPRATGADGTFSIVGLSAGHVVVNVSVGDVWDEATAKEVEAGDQHVVLTIDPGLELVVRIDDWPARRAAWTHARLSPQGDPESASLSVRVASDGTARFRGLKADRAYTLWIPPDADAWSLLRRDVRATSGDVHVRLARGKSITGRLLAADGMKARRVVASMDGAGGVSGTVKADGTYEIVGLPDGTWSVEASGLVDTTRHAAQGTAPAGGTLDLALRPE